MGSIALVYESYIDHLLNILSIHHLFPRLFRLITISLLISSMLREYISYLLFSDLIVFLDHILELLKHFKRLFAQLGVFLLLAELFELAQFLMVNPVEWLATASQLFQALLHHKLVLVSQYHVSILVNHVGHMQDCLPDLVDWLDSIAYIFSETLLICQVLRRVLTPVKKCVLNVDWIVSRVDFAPHEIERELIEDLRLGDEGSWVKEDLVMIHFTILV